ncbi:TAXI family TRAP transporter solute-binding subunit [Phytobacter diazotrophicus]|uniref:TAXI family TRAP transporter solute-binding subunit n=1 Tax=Phytobacter diazotrophicus TaxID=395631 RepID=UPI00232C4592|nr:TAXI family TRAP transporter solute-binding subunit [Phytobacter diazotrophicus]MDC0726581.1 TAXI family TRAP transporter solute-binding subunit [Phytobacter diazotrophicus]MDC0733864.1 TAXI family TRAP transporter solute-binding subunit [Phytobacter diazotrophicus]
MKKSFTAIAAVLLFSSFGATAADITITTGQQGLTYNAVYGVNLAGALSEYGYKSTVVPSKGSLDNLDKVASGEAQIGFTQADAFQFWRSRHGNEAQKVDIIGELGDECVFVAVKDGGKVGSESDLKEGIKIAVGEPASGSYASWQYLQSLEKDYAKVETYAKGGVRSLAKVTTWEYDAFLWVSAPDRTNKFLESVNQKGSGLTMISMNGWNVDDKLPNGKAVYELKKAVTESGWLSDSKVKVPCTKTLVVANTDAGDDMLETASTVLLKNLSRVLGNK